ncbi:MAG: tol-pal system protein YbgF [Candidatus Eiseniibacteriota bacterium]
MNFLLQRRRVGAAGTMLVLAAALPFAAGCYSPALLASRGGLDSLRVRVDTLMVRDSVAYALLLETRHELDSQRDLLLSTRASTGTTSQEVSDQMSHLGARLDEVMGRFNRLEQRSPAPAAAAGAPAVDPGAIYDQAAQDLTQGRYALALQGFRDFVLRFPTHDLADNAQYGVGECFFAQAKFDSASTEYARVDQSWPEGDKVPAALYKLALCQEKLEQKTDSRKTLEALVKRFPLSGEAQLARERLGGGHK